jgi:hypothetical protein
MQHCYKQFCYAEGRTRLGTFASLHESSIAISCPCRQGSECALLVTKWAPSRKEGRQLRREPQQRSLSCHISTMVFWLWKACAATGAGLPQKRLWPKEECVLDSNGKGRVMDALKAPSKILWCCFSYHPKHFDNAHHCCEVCTIGMSEQSYGCGLYT